MTFDSQGGSAFSPAAAAHGGKVVKPGNPTRSGYTFGGWYKDSGCTNVWSFDTGAVTGDMTLYAKWAKNNNSGSSSYTPPAYPPTIERPSEGGGNRFPLQSEAGRYRDRHPQAGCGLRGG